MKKALDVVGIGNALVDVLARVEEEFLIRNNIIKSAMNLVDADRSALLYDAMPPGIEASGGSGANTIAGLASLGADVAYIGKVRDDQLGQVFTHDIRALGVEFTVPQPKDGDPTGRCLIMITPDSHRSMNTYLGASQGLGPDDVEPDLIKRGAITYLEGYLWDPPEAKKAFAKAIDIAHGASRQVSLTLSDSFCVDRFRDEFRELIEEGKIDILFANEDEIKSLYECDFDEAVAAVRGVCPIAAITRSEKGAMAVTAERIWEVPAQKVALEDTTGAGDLFASGFLYGVAKDLPLGDAAALGVACASEVISHIGPRPQMSLKTLL